MMDAGYFEDGDSGSPGHFDASDRLAIMPWSHPLLLCAKDYCSCSFPVLTGKDTMMASIAGRASSMHMWPARTSD
jgi:hypothetical protein